MKHSSAYLLLCGLLSIALATAPKAVSVAVVLEGVGLMVCFAAFAIVWAVRESKS